nr:hypothetical protein [Streptomyces sp. G11C(2021)]
MDQVSFVHGDAAGHVCDEPVDLAACLGATWVGGGRPRHRRPARPEPAPRRA